ncbi:MAG TPA: hypothetical protein VN461_02865 [Vicinamibacteria bacterium]|jgi:hypothetical protein|nr:hypothetical protein [Vicinamibacteria bacterium]
MFFRVSWVVLLAVSLVACASTKGGTKRTGGLDLGPARVAVDEARRAGAPQRVPEIFNQAEGHLKEAEALSANSAAAPDATQRAEILGRLAAAEARCATDLTRLYPKGPPTDKAAHDNSEVAGRLRRSEEERRRLEQRVSLLQRELELTETEVVRTKARLQGIETKADASSAIAEARILMGRLDARDKVTLGRCQELLAKAERQLSENNFGAAVFFARKVQDMVTKGREASPPPP